MVACRTTRVHDGLHDHPSNRVWILLHDYILDHLSQMAVALLERPGLPVTIHGQVRHLQEDRVVNVLLLLLVFTSGMCLL